MLNNKLVQYLQGFLDIIFPNTCAACGKVLYYNEKSLCLNCYIDLPKTGYHLDTENEVSRLFWGRIPFNKATSFIFFSKESRFRHIIHEIKYKNQQDLAVYMGRLFGLELVGSDFSCADLIVPVPLHPVKLKRRGYNQSQLIAKGLSEILKIPVMSDLLFRISNTKSQTKKTRFDRWLNVENTFMLNQKRPVSNKHILLVDDVITTGATIEACAGALYKLSGITVSIASLAYVKLR